MTQPMTDVERLAFELDDSTDIIRRLGAEIERLREEVKTWRDAYEAERQDHEATMKAWDAERSGM